MKLFNDFRVRLRRSNTLGRYDRPNSVAGDAPTASGFLSSLTAMSSNSSNNSPNLNVCLDCKHAVESMITKQQQQQQQPRWPSNTASSVDSDASFQQRRRFSYQDYTKRRSIVTKSLILD